MAAPPSATLPTSRSNSVSFSDFGNEHGEHHSRGLEWNASCDEPLERSSGYRPQDVYIFVRAKTRDHGREGFVTTNEVLTNLSCAAIPGLG